MGKKKKEGNLGKMLIKDRFGQRKQRGSGDNFLHTTELNDGYDWGRLNLQSVTEQSNLDDFLSTAELAGTEFTAEKLNIKFVDPSKNSGLLSETEQANVECLHEQHRNLLRIPRRPHWDSTTSPEELDNREKASFLEWRKSLSTLSEVEGIVLTPYEKNLDFWRQLWRVIERSDIIVQIVDARNPLLFRCEDVDDYVKEVNHDKVNLLLVNKADLLTQEQRKMWCDYFTDNNIMVAFWSALAETERQKEILNEEVSSNENMDEDEYDDDDDDDESEEEIDEVDVEDKDLQNEKHLLENVSDEIEERLQSASVKDGQQTSSEGESTSKNTGDLTGSETSCDIGDILSNTENGDTSKDETSEMDHTGNVVADDGYHKNSPELLSGEELLKLFRILHSGPKAHEGQTTIGMVGYPNVGKSSTINAILKMKKVPVSATPGRTKHFQTLYVENDLMLCDCPGLVFPSFVSTKAELVVNGILPIDQMRDHLPPVALVCHHIPKNILEEMYGINIPLPLEGEDPNRPPTAYELLNTYGMMRGFMTSNGLPDCPRTSRYILKDYVKGKLLFCKNPPGTDPEEFNCACTVIPEDKKKVVSASLKASAPNQSKLDKEFFTKIQPKAHSKGPTAVSNFTRVEGVRQIGSESSTSLPSTSTQSLNEKPWKKHHNVKKKEKLRRQYKDHDAD